MKRFLSLLFSVLALKSMAQCENYTVQIFSYVVNSGPTLVEWNIENAEGNVVNPGGTASFSMFSYQQTYTVCLEPGCYVLNLGGNAVLSDQNFIATIMLGETILYPEVPLTFGSSSMEYSFCTEVSEPLCDACFTPSVFEGFLTINNCSSPVQPNNTSFTWDFGDGTIGDGAMPTHQYTENGNYQICVVMVVTENGNIVCVSEQCAEISVEGLVNESCPEVIWSGAGEDCGLMLFEIGSFVEGENVVWYPGDETGAFEGGHFYSHTYAQPGNYTVCAFYTSPLCPDGVELCTEITVQECNEDCPVSIGMDQIDCDSYYFIVQGVETGNVVWHFGDGTSETSVVYADHTFAENGVYIITAEYSGPSCPFGTTLIYTVEVNCEGGCPQVIAYESHCDQGTVTLFVPTLNTDAVLTWMVNNDLFYSDGPLLNIEIPEGLFDVCVWSDSLTIEGCPELCDEFIIECDVEGCNIITQVLQQDCNTLVLAGGGVPNPEALMWSQNGNIVNTGYVTTFTLEPGANNICVWYQGELCSDEMCSVYYGCDGDGCPDQIWVGAGEDCGVMNFEIGSFLEGQDVVWYPGDETGAVEGGHFFSHAYAEPGEYTLCAVYSDPNCEGAELCVTFVVEPCEECETVNMSFDSFVADGGPAYLTWTLGELEGNVLYEGVAQYSNEDPWYDSNLCLYDGCYVLNLCTTVEFNTEALNLIFSDNFEVVSITPTNNFLCYGYEIILSLNGDCGSPECTDVAIDLTSYQSEGGAHYIQWALFNADGIAVHEGLHEYTNDNPYYSVPLCLPDGCYTMVVEDMTSGELSYDTFFPWVFIGGEQVDLIGDLLIEGNLATFTFGVNSDCGEQGCSGNEITLQVTTSAGENPEDACLFTIYLDDMFIGQEDFEFCADCPDTYTWTYCLEDGCYQIELESMLETNAEFIMIQAFMAGVELPIGALELLNGETSGILEFGLNADCNESVQEGIFSGMNFFPNPASHQLNWTAVSAVNGQARIYDIYGRIVFDSKLSGVAGQLNVDGLAPGLYQLFIQSGNEIVNHAVEIAR
ncbi:MAG: hypothetical protein RL220_168 [Bacteroidota bacterium]